ncbi:MAG: right-handed parallel beta-helix repeat-containing protein, partial [Sedimentisphaerales bacterium]|nr:right-handed parallel beta-helix repeat-containing protein [Sedimentisphaerales bacterium]
MKTAIITIWLTFVVLATPAFTAELLVPSQYPTIQAAIDAAANGDTVVIAPGTYTGDGNRDIAFGKAITVRSQNGPETCIIDCNGSPGQLHRGFIMESGTLIGVTITGGYLGEFDGGGAVICEHGRAKLINCTLTSNFGMRGGAVLCMGGNLEIINCSLTNNSAEGIWGGGAILCQQNSSIFITNCTISGNSAKGGGGIYCTEESSITIRNCVIRDNSATDTWTSLWGGGGGIHCDNGSAIVIGTDIMRNLSPHGAGIYCAGAKSFIIIDCNIYGNIAETDEYGPAGGGICYAPFPPPPWDGATFEVINSTITDNVVRGWDSKGGGLYLGTDYDNSHVVLTGCVVARNSAQAPSDERRAYGGGLYSTTRVQLFETEFKENSASQGGGIYNTGPGIDMSRCRLNHNIAYGGNAIMCAKGEAKFESCVISRNQGFVWYEWSPTIQCNDDVILNFTNCTIIGNACTAIWVGRPANLSSIKNSIIYWNGRPDGDCWRQIPSTIPSVSYTDVQDGYDGVGNIDADPCLVNAGYWDTNGTPEQYDDFWVEGGDYRLMAASPCINSGGSVSLMDNKDLAGNARVTGTAIDMGAYEYQNTPPVANAGPNQVACAWIDGIAEVTLDGSGSYDADSDVISYLWRWMVDGNNYEANGVNPTIRLPVGERTIRLIVSDGIDNSQPDDVVIAVIGPIEGRPCVAPRVINRQGEQPDILAMLRLPAGITKEQIDAWY